MPLPLYSTGTSMPMNCAHRCRAGTSGETSHRLSDERMLAIRRLRTPFENKPSMTSRSITPASSIRRTRGAMTSFEKRAAAYSG